MKHIHQVFTLLAIGAVTFFLPSTAAQSADEAAASTWKYSASLLRPFWVGDTVEGESVLFIKDAKTGTAKASVLFPVTKMLAVRNSVGDVLYTEGKDYTWTAGSREIAIPVGSRIKTQTADELRRPAKSQQYQLTHRDGNGEILFGGRLEYAEMQTCLTYSHEPNLCKSAVPKFDPKVLPRTIQRLQQKQPLKIVLLGDSISTGANASGIFKAAPFQPAYPDLLRSHLEAHYGSQVELVNHSVGGTSTDWGITQMEKVIAEKPDLVILAFGMNDSSGRPAKDYSDNTTKMIAAAREKLPEVEFILVASMLGNANWIALKQELFPQYRDALAKLCQPGIALADVTAVWAGILELKQDWDQTGNGVNHPNDFGHRIYAQVLAALLVPSE